MEIIKLDLIPGKKMPSLHASQFDDGRAYHIDLTENRVPYVLDGTETISVIVRKCDNTLVSMDIANTFANKSYLEFEVVEQMTACDGFNYGEIILEKNGDRLGSLNFYLVVETAPDENGITSKSEIKNLKRQVHDIVVEELADNGAEETGYDNTKSGLDATNVQDALDELAQKPSVDAYTKTESDAFITDEYDATSTYAIGDMVIHENALYVCSTAITTAEAWNSAHWTLTDIATAIGTVKTAIPTKTSDLQNDSGFAQIDDSEESASKTYSSEKIEAVVKPISDKVDATTEGGVSKNIYPTSYLSEASGITYSNGIFSGKASAFSGATRLTSFEENTRYTAQITARKISGDYTTGNGLILRFDYDDTTYMSTYVSNATTSWTKFTLTSDEGKVISDFRLSYASGGNDIWEVKEVQVEKGTTATSWVSPDAMPLTAIDKTARGELSLIPKLPWWSRFQNEFLRIAYSAIWVDKINTAVHWLFASDMGFNVLKGDVEITSDGELIMCHDPGFTFDENGRIINYNSSNKTLIVDMTYAECRSKEYADNPSRYGGYCPVADVDDFIRICKDKGKICFLTIRATNTAQVVAKAVEKIKYYGMESRTILNAVSSSIIDVIRANPDTSEMAVNFVAPEGTAITTAQVDKCLEWGNAFLSIWADGVTSVIDNSDTAIAYAKEKGVPILAAVNGEMSFWNYLIKKGVMGYQITKPIFDVEPKSQRFSVKMTSGTPTFENLFASNRFTATVSVSGLRIYVSDVCITDSYLTNVIDGIQPIKMNMLNPDIKCFDTSGNSYTCVWSSAHNRFEITIPDTNDRTYRVLVTV